MKAYGKVIAALVFAAITAVQAAISDGHLTPTEWVQVAIAVTTAAIVWLVPALPQAPWTKTALGAVLAALNVLVTVIAHGVSAYDLTEIALAVLTALGVGLAPAVSTVAKLPGRAPSASPVTGIKP